MSTNAQIGLGLTACLCITLGMAWTGAQSNWRYYVTVDECLAMTSLPAPVRVSGDIIPGSLEISEGRRGAAFELAGSRRGLRVCWVGPVPSHLADAKQVIVEGVWTEQSTLEAEQVFTRCASKYTAQRSPNAAEYSGPGAN